MMTSDWPSDEVERSSSTWLMVLTESSIYDFRFHFLGGSAGIRNHDLNSRNVNLGEQIDAKTEVGKYADDDERKNQHRREYRPSNTELR